MIIDKLMAKKTKFSKLQKLTIKQLLIDIKNHIQEDDSMNEMFAHMEYHERKIVSYE